MAGVRKLVSGDNVIQFEDDPTLEQVKIKANLAPYPKLADLSSALDDKGDALITAKYIAPEAVPLNLHEYIEDDGSYNVMGFVPQNLKAAIRDLTTTTAITTHFQDALSQGRRLFLPRGKFIIEAPMEPTQNGVRGEGRKRTRIVCDGCHAFEIPSNAGYDRPAAVFEGFAVESDSNSCDDKWVFHAPGVASGAAVVHNSGLTLRDIEVGRNGRMGGFAYLKDFFRVVIERIGGTDLSRGVQLAGSVVQAEIRSFVANNDSAASVMPRYGLSTEAATYDSGVMTPENVDVQGFKFIRCARGISHQAGLFARFVGLDTEADEYGVLLNAAAALEHSLVAPGTGVGAAWVGVYVGVSPSEPDDGVWIDKLDINMLRLPGLPAVVAQSYGIDLGDGVSPVYMVDAERIRVRGMANSLQSAIRGRDLRSFRLTRAAIRVSAIVGDEIDVTGRRIKVLDNDLPGGTITVSDGGEATARGEVMGNQCSTVNLTLTTPDNWTISGNDEASEARGYGQAHGTFTGTLTGCTTSPTGTLRWDKQSRMVTLHVPQISGTSNTTAATLTGLPSTLIPNRTQDVWGTVTNGGNTGLGAFRVRTDGVIELFVGASFSAFTNAGNKGVQACTIAYTLS